jgi:Zn-dependent M28 family amino/carboxypeptidase
VLPLRQLWLDERVLMSRKGKTGFVVAGAATVALVLMHYHSRGNYREAVKEFDRARAFEDLKRLVALGPRPPGSSAIKRAREYITAQLGAAGAEVLRDSFTATTPAGPIPMVNIVGILPGKNSGVVIVAAHYDTARVKGITFVGANDGGSSAAELLELVRDLSGRSHRLTYWFVFFDGEEAIEYWSASDSLYGSRHFVEALRGSGKLRDVRAVVLLDMVGGGDPQFRPEANSTLWLRELVYSSADRLGYRDAFPSGGAIPVEDDHLPFLAAGMPAVDIIDFTPFLRGYHHTALDTLDHCSPDTLAMVGHVVLGTLGELERSLKNYDSRRA